MPNNIALHTEVVIDSCHKLNQYLGNCSRLHGHSWVVHLDFLGDKKYKDKVGILVDFNIVKTLKDVLDHQYINDIINHPDYNYCRKDIKCFDTININPTAENLSEWIYNFIRKEINKNILIHIKVYETAVGKETYCEFGDDLE